MITAAALMVKVGGDVGGALSGLSAVNKSVSRTAGFFGSAASTAVGFGAAMAGIGAVGAAGGALSGAVTDSLALNAAFETTQIGLETLLGAAAGAQFQLDLKQFAKDTPFAYEQLATLSRQLIGTGFAAQSIIPLLGDVGNVASAMGAGKDGVDRITRALQQMKGVGKVQRGELNQLSEVGINGLDILATYTGKSVKKINKELDGGKIGADTFIAAFTQFARQSKFADAMAKQAKSGAGIWDNLMETFGLAKADVFEPLFQGLKQIGGAVLEFTRGDVFAGWVAAARGHVAGLVGEFLTVFTTARNIAGAHGVGAIDAAIIAVRGRIAEVFGEKTATVFDGVVEGIKALPGTLGKIKDFFVTEFPKAIADIKALAKSLETTFTTIFATIQKDFAVFVISLASVPGLGAAFGPAAEHFKQQLGIGQGLSGRMALPGAPGVNPGALPANLPVATLADRGGPSIDRSVHMTFNGPVGQSELNQIDALVNAQGELTHAASPDAPGQ